MRQIFVGSSVEGVKHAEEVVDLLKRQCADVTPVIWREIFEPGYLTFEALEAMLHHCCAAVFVASPDDDGTIRGRAVKVPRANVMLEFGLVAGRLGRHNISVCRYGGAELPSDLKGLTVIRMEPEPDPPMLGADAAKFKKAAEEELCKWATGLIGTAEECARTEVVHGYTGRWHFEASLEKWRGIQVQEPDYAVEQGSFDLFVEASGQCGNGFSHARLTFGFEPHQGNSHRCYGEYHVSHEITSVCCKSHGGLSFTSRHFALHKLTASHDLRSELVGLKEPPEPWLYQWELRPTNKPLSFEGSLEARSGWTTGKVTATKDREAYS
jgi:hypothetical protein